MREIKNKLNAELDNISDQIQTANVQAAGDKIFTLVSEGKRQKIIEIADSSKMVGRSSKNTNQTTWPVIQRKKETQGTERSGE